MIPPEWEIVVTIQSITKEHWGGGKGEGLKESQAAQLRPPQTRDSDKATTLHCLGDPTPKPETGIGALAHLLGYSANTAQSLELKVNAGVKEATQGRSDSVHLFLTVLACAGEE